MHRLHSSKLRHLILVVLLISAAPRGWAQLGGSGRARTNSTDVPGQGSRAPRVISKSGNGQTWESVKASTNADGVVTFRTNRVQELATGMHYLDSTSGAWKGADPTFVET